MISEEYKKAVDLTLPSFARENEFERGVEVFKFLVEKGHYAGQDDIFQYVIGLAEDREDVDARNNASEIQQVYEVVKAVLRPDIQHWQEDFLSRELLGE